MAFESQVIPERLALAERQKQDGFVHITTSHIVSLGLGKTVQVCCTMALGGISENGDARRQHAI
jgi:hypothetical protein